MPVLMLITSGSSEVWLAAFFLSLAVLTLGFFFCIIIANLDGLTNVSYTFDNLYAFSVFFCYTIEPKNWNYISVM